MPKLTPASLTTLAGGAAVEMFDDEMRKVFQNIVDPNTKAKHQRSVTLTVSMTPNEDRNRAPLTVSVKSGLAPTRSAVSEVFISQSSEGVAAHEFDPEQMGLDEVRTTDQAEADDDVAQFPAKTTNGGT